MKLIRYIRAKINKVPFREKEWYNFRAFIQKDEEDKYPHIEIFDENNKYIPCPKVGGTVVYNNKGKRFLYKVVGFKNSSRDSDWIYDSDYINPVIEFIKPL